MNDLAVLIQGFFTDRLPNQRGASPQTIASYRDAVKLLLVFAAEHHSTRVDALNAGHIDAETVAAFLAHPENDRGNSVATRNARLAAIRSLFRYAAIRLPEHSLDIARVLDIPNKRTDKRIVDYLNDEQVAVLVAAPDASTWTGRRDRLIMAFMAQTGLLASETVAVRVQDVRTGASPYVECVGKGRKHRTTPLDPVLARQIEAWTAENCLPDVDPVFPAAHGGHLTRNGLWRIVVRHGEAVAGKPGMVGVPVTPHVLRHAAAMRLLHAGIDVATIAMRLGHERLDTTLIYLHADLERKQQAFDQTAPPGVPPGRYAPTPEILEFLAGRGSG
ncbi:MAG: site-specific integrase [Bifidobacteriaceae bacterium]|nr:site-specific integrase [Bifidobacteriaceae bacterium]